jgi:hypothetical protein
MRQLMQSTGKEAMSKDNTVVGVILIGGQIERFMFTQYQTGIKVVGEQLVKQGNQQRIIVPSVEVGRRCLHFNTVGKQS